MKKQWIKKVIGGIIVWGVVTFSLYRGRTNTNISSNKGKFIFIYESKYRKIWICK